MINHSTKSPLREHKDVSPGAKQLLSVLRRWFTVWALAAGITEQFGDAKLTKSTRQKSSVPLKSCNIDMFCWWRWRSPVLLSVAIMAIRSVTHSINQTDCWFVYPERSETAVSVPASCSLTPLCLSQPRLISALQLSLILPLHCRLHKEFQGELESWPGVLLLIQSLLPERARRILLV